MDNLPKCSKSPPKSQVGLLMEKHANVIPKCKRDWTSPPNDTCALLLMLQPLRATHNNSIWCVSKTAVPVVFLASPHIGIIIKHKFTHVALSRYTTVLFSGFEMNVVKGSNLITFALQIGKSALWCVYRHVRGELQTWAVARYGLVGHIPTAWCRVQRQTLH